MDLLSGELTCVLYQRVDQIINDDVLLELDEFLPRSRLVLKLENYNPAGSIKLKTAVSMVDNAEAAGRLTAGDTIVESSSGNFGVAMSLVAAARGYRFVCVTDERATTNHIRTMRALGAEVIVAGRRNADDTYLASRLRIVADYLEATPGSIWLNQYSNTENPRAHESTTAAAILKNVGHVDYLFIGLGTAGTFSGCARRFRNDSPWTRIIAVDSVGSVTLGGAPAPRHLPGLGAGVMPKHFDPTEPDDAVSVHEKDAVLMCRMVAAKHGLLIGASTGSVLAAVRQYAPRLADRTTTVAISPDSGDRYLDLVYSDRWVQDRFGELPIPAYSATS